jgi:agmatine deiminase
MRTLKGTPAADGFRMPAEFERQAGCWMLWPLRPDNWRRRAVPAQAAFAAVAAAIARFEPVSVGVARSRLAAARALLPPAARVVALSSDDAWMRDVGPTFVVDARGRRRGVDWRFNAWGGKSGGLYASWRRDDRVAHRVLALEGADRYLAPLVMEGGAIHVDGQGACLTTEECLLNPNRNPRLARGQVERLLREYLGVRRVIWLGRGVYRDETDGHIDELCCFVRPGEVLLTWTDDRADPQYDISREALERLHAARDARGRRLKVHKLVQPGPLYMTREEAAGIRREAGSHPRRAGDRLPASYINFLIVNGGVIAPLLDPRRDGEAMATLRRLFPDREVVGVPAREILLGGGGIHCITQQVPAA